MSNVELKFVLAKICILAYLLKWPFDLTNVGQQLLLDFGKHILLEIKPSIMLSLQLTQTYIIEKLKAPSYSLDIFQV